MGSGGSILPGGHAPGTAPTATPTLAEVVTFLDWFGHPNNNDCDSVSLSDLSISVCPCLIFPSTLTMQSHQCNDDTCFSQAHGALGISWIVFKCKHPAWIDTPPFVPMCLSPCPCTLLLLALVSLLSLMKSLEDQVPWLRFPIRRSTLMMPPPQLLSLSSSLLLLSTTTMATHSLHWLL